MSSSFWITFRFLVTDNHSHILDPVCNLIEPISALIMGFHSKYVEFNLKKIVIFIQFFEESSFERGKIFKTQKLRNHEYLM